MVGSLGSGEESEDSEVDSQGSGGDVEQQVGSPGRLRRLTGLAHLLLHVSAFTLFIDLRVLLHPARRPLRPPRPRPPAGPPHQAAELSRLQLYILGNNANLRP